MRISDWSSDVCSSDLRSEMAAKGANYLRRNNMVRRDGWIVQLPGPDNALGQVKFDMRNDYAIYLHDTPAQHLFESAKRHQIGRATCRERVCHYVYISVVAVSLKKKEKKRFNK